MALAAFAAFAVLPSLASANPIITHPTGVVYCPNGGAKGEECKILATNVGETIMETPVGPLKCNKASMTGTVTVNETAKGSEGNITSAHFSGTGTTVPGEPEAECTGAFGNASITPTVSATAPWCLQATEANDKFKLRGGSCSGATKPIEFAIVVTIFGSPVNCKYERTTLKGPVEGTITTDTATGEDAILGIENVEFPVASGQSGFCPSKGELTMKFTLETDSPVSEPMYFSP